MVSFQKSAVQEADAEKGGIRSRVLAGVEDKALEIPTLPESNARIEMISEEEVINVQEFTSALACDPGVASQIMQIANSPPYGGGRPVGSIGVAVKQLGLRYASELAHGLASRQVFQPTNEMIERRYRLAVSDATFVGAAAAVLARDYTEISAERARLAGLVHNLGIFPVLAQAEYENFTDTFALETIVDTVHVVLSSTLLRRWNFPKEVADIPQGLVSHQRTNAELGLIDLVAVGIQLNVYFNHSAPAATATDASAVEQPKMDQQLAMMIYDIAGFDPLANQGQVELMRKEIEAEHAGCLTSIV